MVWVYSGLGIFAWFLLLIFLGTRTLTRGHWVMFAIGLLLPVFWLVGAFIPPKQSVTTASRY